MKLVNWEQHLDVKYEENRGKPFHAGEVGMVAVMTDNQNNGIAITDGDWRA